MASTAQLLVGGAHGRRAALIFFGHPSQNNLKHSTCPNCFFCGVPNVVLFFPPTFGVAVVTVFFSMKSFEPKCPDPAFQGCAFSVACVFGGQRCEDMFKSVVGGCALAKLSRAAGAHGWRRTDVFWITSFLTFFVRQMRSCGRQPPLTGQGRWEPREARSASCLAVYHVLCVLVQEPRRSAHLFRVLAEHLGQGSAWIVAGNWT